MMILSGTPPVGDDPPQNNAIQQDARDRIFYPSDTERPIPLGKKLVARLSEFVSMGGFSFERRSISI
jgi:hypothetical protein